MTPNPGAGFLGNLVAVSFAPTGLARLPRAYFDTHQRWNTYPIAQSWSNAANRRAVELHRHGSPDFPVRFYSLASMMNVIGILQQLRSPLSLVSCVTSRKLEHCVCDSTPPKILNLINRDPMSRITDFGKEGDPQFLIRPEINVKPFWIPDVPFIRHPPL